MKKSALIAVGILALALSFAPAAFANSSIQIDANGDGAGAITVGALDWNVGNAILLNIAGGGTIQSYSHGALSVFNDALGKSLGGVPGGGEWTYILGVGLVDSGPGTFTSIAAGENFFRIFFDSTADSNMLAGTGFADGKLILEGTINVGGTETFTETGGGPGTPLDAFGADNYPAIDSVTGVGGGSLLVTVTFSDPAFFLTPPTLIGIDFATQNILPFGQTDPSALFTNAALGTLDGATVGSVGTCNGCTDAQGAGPNVMLQVDGNSSFTNVVIETPLPGTLMLLGMGAGLITAGTAVLRRRRA